MTQHLAAESVVSHRVGEEQVTEFCVAGTEKVELGNAPPERHLDPRGREATIVLLLHLLITERGNVPLFVAQNLHSRDKYLWINEQRNGVWLGLAVALF